MDLDNIYIPLLEENKELPDRDLVLARFRESFFERLQKGAQAAEAAATMRPIAAPEGDAQADGEGDAAFASFTMDESDPASVEDQDAAGSDSGDLFAGFGDDEPED